MFLEVPFEDAVVCVGLAFVALESVFVLLGVEVLEPVDLACDLSVMLRSRFSAITHLASAQA